MSTLQQLYKYREYYTHRDDTKINTKYVQLIDQTISEIEELENKIACINKLLKLIDVLFFNLNWTYSRNLRDYLSIPDYIFNELLAENIGKGTTEIIQTLELYLLWEIRLSRQIEDIKLYKSLKKETKKIWKETLTPKEREPYEMADDYDITIIENYYRSKYVSFIKKTKRYDDKGNRPTA